MVRCFAEVVETTLRLSDNNDDESLKAVAALYHSKASGALTPQQASGWGRGFDSHKLISQFCVSFSTLSSSPCWSFSALVRVA